MTNEAAIGYMILAAKDLRLDKEIISQLVENMRYFMDVDTESEAEKAYREF